MLLINVVFFPMNSYLYYWKFSYNLTPIKETILMIQGANIHTSLRNIIGNFILLLPLGTFLPVLDLNYRKWYKTFFFGIAVSLLIEILQLVLMIRIFDIDDILFNSVSVVIGYLVYYFMNKIRVFDNILKKIENTKNIAFFKTYAISVGSIVSSILILWVINYFNATIPTKNILDENIQGRIVSKCNQFGYYFILSEKSNNEIIAYGYRNTPFNRVSLGVTSTPITMNEYSNSYNYMGNSTVDEKMLYVVYGYNSMGKIKLVVESNGQEITTEIPKGYYIFPYKFEFGGKYSFSIRFFDSANKDITYMFDGNDK
ncbi:MAG: VanZ family protein [Clostridia bacterium]|nr:VanZ family protein [Clostridia bacterium]